MIKLFFEFIDILMIFWIRWRVMRGKLEKYVIPDLIANVIADEMKEEKIENFISTVIPEYRGKHGYQRRPFVFTVRWANGKTPEEILYKRDTGISEVIT